jgi:hypothetical protein
MPSPYEGFVRPVTTGVLPGGLSLLIYTSYVTVSFGSGSEHTHVNTTILVVSTRELSDGCGVLGLFGALLVVPPLVFIVGPSSEHPYNKLKDIKTVKKAIKNFFILN